jgi:transketolase
VIECDGHSLAALHSALAEGVSDDVPTVILAHTIIGKGVSFMEDDPQFHGRGLTAEEYPRAMAELGLDPEALGRARAERDNPCTVAAADHATAPVAIDPGTPRTYAADAKADCRSAWGAALVDLADANPDTVLAVLDCDLAQSVKTEAFWAKYPARFIECGVGEHNAATIGGALSTVPGALAFWADFGVFGIDEVYNQQRLNDINGAALKLTVTHCGLDVGEDGKTHQCIDYVGALRTLLGWRVIVPADANQTDRAVRSAAAMQGNVAIAMGRSKLPTITDAAGQPLFAGAYEFTPGAIAWAREGADVVLLAMGTLAGAAAAAADQLKAAGIGAAVGVVAMPLELDDTAMRRASDAPLLVTVEDHSVRSGLGASVAEWLVEHTAHTRLVRLGVEGYSSSGASADLFARAGLDASSIAERVKKELRGS